MPAVSQAQQRFMGAELSKKRAGKPTKTKMSEDQLRDFAKKKKGKPLPKKRGYSDIEAARRGGEDFEI